MTKQHDQDISNAELAAMMQREFLALHEKIDGKPDRQEVEKQFKKVEEDFEEVDGRLTSIERKLDTEIQERDRQEERITALEHART